MTRFIPVPKSIDGADLLAWQLTAAGLTGFIREHKPFPDRRFRIDLAHLEAPRLAVEVMGGIWSGGKHVRPSGYASNCEKACLLAIARWYYLPVTTEQVKNGQALAWIERALSVT